MSNYKISIKHVLESEWLDLGVHWFETLDEASKVAHEKAVIYYNILAERYNLPTLEDFINASEELTGNIYGTGLLPCEEVDSLYWSYFNRMMKWKVVEVG